MEELKVEYVKSLQCSYARVLLPESPDEKRYQYCILKRGGITGILPCTVRYINTETYLYFDVTSMQSVTQLYRKKTLDRAWVRDFVWNVRRVRQEMERFLLDEGNVIWHPDYIYQDLGDRVFSFLYLPYYGRENGFAQALEFLSEHIDYRDETLVECVYGMYEQYRQNGETYLQSRIYEDVRILEDDLPAAGHSLSADTGDGAGRMQPEGTGQQADVSAPESGREPTAVRESPGKTPEREQPPARKGLFSFFEGARKKSRDARANYRELNRLAMDGFAVAQSSPYEARQDARGDTEELSTPEPEEAEAADLRECDPEDGESRTVYLENVSENRERTYRLYRENGAVLCALGEEAVVIGKSPKDADVVLEDVSVSRMHARIFPDGESYYVEDLNSTNGTFKNGLRLQPYEKRMLTPEDELGLGAVPLVFR